MDARNPNQYTRTAIALHGIVAALIVANLLFGLYMTGLSLSPQKLKYFSWHKWIGVTVFMLVTFRLLWRLTHPAPALPRTMPDWQLKAAHVSHVLLYVLFFAAPLSGWLFSSANGFQTVYLGMFPIPDLLGKNKELADVLKLVHKTVVYSLGGLVVVHIAAGLKHHFVDRDDVLTRMYPFLKVPSPRPPEP
ncbi:Cytochrome b561 [Usitatibacter palustris]|uniref:Cytochrome b561 n=2 Tax=Usitatibacter palustris TaxID=2732487 RepID=A0A6M4H685_9PROT|nr:Cytochrome b561 [Usitatibacter palustris]